MQEMRDSGIEWVGAIPSHWEVKANKYIMRKIKNINPIYHGEDILSLTINGVIVRDLDAGGKMPTSFDGYQILYPNNLLMCLFDYDVTPRCIGLIKNNGLTSPAYSQFVLDHDNDAGYYYYYYLMVDNTKALLHLAKNLRHSFTEDQLGAINVPVPPIVEQRKIASFLDQKCEEISSMVADIQAEIDTLEEYKRSVISQTVTKGLNPDVEMKNSGIEWIGMIPKSWAVKKVKYACKTRNEKYSHINGDLEYFALENIVGWNFKYVKTDNEYDLEGANLCYKNDVVFGKLRPYLAKTFLVDYDRCCSSEFAVFHDFEGLAKYYLYVFTTQGFVNTVNNSTAGVKMPRANIEFINNVFIPVAPVEEQEKIADYLDDKCSQIDSIIAVKKKQLELLEEYKKSLIYEYVTGKKEVPSSETNTTVAVNPQVILLGAIIDQIGNSQHGRVQLQKLLYLCNIHFGLNPNVQYYRYNHGPYDVHLNDHINELLKKHWYYEKRENGNYLLISGRNHKEFLQNHVNPFGEKQREISKLFHYLKDMRTSQLERIATLYAAWNDFLIDGITPSDDQIIQNVVSCWTDNKANSQYSTWQDSLNKMRRYGLIPRGQGLHTLPKPQKEVSSNE